MAEEQERPISRERRVEEFGEEHVQHTEWWAEEMSRVEEAQHAVLEAIKDRDDVRLARRGRSVGRDGLHEATFRLDVAGEPWEGVDDAE